MTTLISFSIGNKVAHPQLGVGEIVNFQYSPDGVPVMAQVLFTSDKRWLTFAHLTNINHLKQLANEAAALSTRLCQLADEAREAGDNARRVALAVTWYKNNRRMWRRLKALKAVRGGADEPKIPTAKDKVIQEAEGQIRNARKAINLMALLPDPEDFPFPVEYSIYATSVSSVVFASLPYDREVFEIFFQALSGEWVQDGKWINTQHGDSVIHRHCGFYPKGADRYDSACLTISLGTDVPGAKCQLRQVGVKEVPVMEIACS